MYGPIQQRFSTLQLLTWVPFNSRVSGTQKEAPADSGALAVLPTVITSFHSPTLALPRPSVSVVYNSCALHSELPSLTASKMYRPLSSGRENARLWWAGRLTHTRLEE